MMLRTKSRYKSIFLLGSLLSAGNTVEYFSKFSEKLVIFYLQPRWDKRNNFIHVYKNGYLVSKHELFSPKNIVLQYLVIYIQYTYTFLKFFKKDEHFFVITYHPLLFFVKIFARVFRNFDIVFWIADYIPNGNIPLKIYQSFIFFFHKKNTYNLYLSDRINKIMNKKVIDTAKSKTVMWGIQKAKYYKKNVNSQRLYLYYNGIVRSEHGIDVLLNLSKSYKNIYLRLLGRCDQELFKYYSKMIKTYGIKERIYFPNRFFSLEELVSESKKCLMSVGLYSVGKKSYAYYTDSGKIKLYAQLGLPIIMTDSSETAMYVKKFCAGEVITRDVESLYNAIFSISNNYSTYLKGLRKFNNYFYFETYYKDKFVFLEKNNSNYLS